MFQAATAGHIDGILGLMGEYYLADGYSFDEAAARAALEEIAQAVCRNAGARALHLEVERGKDGARRLYENSGFVEHSRYLLTKLLA